MLQLQQAGLLEDCTRVAVESSLVESNSSSSLSCRFQVRHCQSLGFWLDFSCSRTPEPFIQSFICDGGAITKHVLERQLTSTCMWSERRVTIVIALDWGRPIANSSHCKVQGSMKNITHIATIMDVHPEDHYCVRGSITNIIICLTTRRREILNTHTNQPEQ